jgi:cysteine desulfurase
MQEIGFEVEVIPITNEGYVDLSSLKQMIRPNTILVSICSVDSEIGLRQPIEEIGEILQAYPHCFFHTDASQAIGKVTIDYSKADLITITPHKFYGLNGFGILVKKNHVNLKPQINGGKSTTIFRSGTPVTAHIVAADKALELALKNTNTRYEYIEKLSTQIKEKLQKYKNVYLNNTKNSIPHTINFSIKGIKSLDIQQKLEEQNIYLSTKTSCCPIQTPSKLVYALTKDKNLSSSSLRLSISHLTTQEEVNTFLKIFDLIYKEYEKNGKI